MRTRPKIVISDSSGLTTLAKAELIERAPALPFEFVIADVMLATGRLGLGHYTGDELLHMGFKLGCLEAAETRRAIGYFRQHRTRLSLNDCFAWRLAEAHRSILMTEDSNLRRLAECSGVEVHGTLWVIASCRSFAL